MRFYFLHLYIAPLGCILFHDETSRGVVGLKAGSKLQLAGIVCFRIDQPGCIRIVVGLKSGTHFEDQACRAITAPANLVLKRDWHARNMQSRNVNAGESTMTLEQK